MSAAMIDAAEEVVLFGPFTLRPAQRELLQGDTPIHLGSRAFDILLLLIERAGTFVEKNEIVARVWPTTVVVEGNLRVHLTALRKALGDGRNGRRYIVTVPNRGYSFVAQVSRAGVGAAHTVDRAAASAAPSLVATLHRIVGRDAAIDSLSRKVRRHRLVTVVGAGGIGKTTLTVSVAAAVTTEPAPWTGVHFVDLAPLSEGRLVPGALAAVLGLRAAVDDALPNILAFLHDKSLLLLFDNCEHVLGEVAQLAEAVLRAAPGVHILATSREPLKADGERVQQLQPLELPAAGAVITAADAIRFGAIELFVDRATATLDTYAFHDADVECVVDICRRLDGIPLAIELAAAFVSSLTVRDIAAALESRLLHARSGRRTATPRHRTLRAVLDWSFGLLSPRDRKVLERLSVFAGNFTLESAGAVASDASLPPDEVFDAVTELAAKSLLSVDVGSDPAYFRPLETTRCYASSRLVESGELPTLRRRHAEHVLELLRESEQAWRHAEASAWKDRYGRHVDDVRTALEWAMSAEGDVELGIAIIVRSASMLFQLSRADECMRYASAAMEALLRLGTVDPKLEFELSIVYAFFLTHTRGVLPGTQRSLERALEIAMEQGAPRQLVVATCANWAGAFIRSDPRAMDAFARQFETLTAEDADPATALLCDRMKAHPLHLLGDQRGARILVERILAAPPVARPPFLTGAWLDRSVTMGMLLARVLWLQGLPDQAEEVAARTVARASRDGESVALAYVLGLAACAVAIWTGRFDLARARVSLLLRHTLEHSLVPWRGFAIAFGSLLDWHDNGRRGHPVLPDGLEIRKHPHQLGDLLATLHPALADETAFRRGDAGDAGWCQAELLRVRAERARAEGRTEAAEALLIRSLERARRDGALSWELRTATSLGRLWMEQGRTDQAIELLQSVLDRVTEGHATPDVREAVALRDALKSAVALSEAAIECS
ncbi:MAG TPA: winged helix-turn-helix domain-containing protein [Albitalea sp.]|uniref:ATP-binding protein n=1 Tax=Piscinibacter sp. TaxID=1903157 RepID=UPI002ED4E9B8